MTEAAAGIKFYTAAGNPTSALTDKITTTDWEFTVYPNPAESHATFTFTLPEAGKTTLALYDLNGRHIMNLMDANMTAGQHTYECS